MLEDPEDQQEDDCEAVERVSGQLLSEDGRALSIESVDQRRELVWDKCVRGYSSSEISRQLGISVTTVNRDLRHLAEVYRDEIIKMDPATIVAQNLQHLRELERIALFEMQLLKPVSKLIRDDKGNTVEVVVTDPNKSRYFQAALQARAQMIRLLVDSGIIPRDSAKMFKPLNTLQSAEQGTDRKQRTQEEIEASIEQLLQKGRMVD